MNQRTKGVHTVKQETLICGISFCAAAFMKNMRDKFSFFARLEWRNDLVLWDYKIKANEKESRFCKETVVTRRSGSETLIKQ